MHINSLHAFIFGLSLNVFLILIKAKSGTLRFQLLSSCFLQFVYSAVMSQFPLLTVLWGGNHTNRVTATFSVIL